MRLLSPQESPALGYFGSGLFSSGGELCDLSIADSVVPRFSRG
ncbi:MULTISPECIES: hypothetical protein [unclassified Streptomyces]|nr:MULTISPECIES: hypothetical protein [unclassified Streptomyces]